MVGWATKKKILLLSIRLVVKADPYNGLWQSPYLGRISSPGPLFHCSIDATGWFPLAFDAQNDAKSLAPSDGHPSTREWYIEGIWELFYKKTLSWHVFRFQKITMFSVFIVEKVRSPNNKNLVLPTLWLYSFCWRFFNSDMVIQHKTSPLLFRDRIEIHTLQHTSIQGTVAKLTPVYVHQDLLRRILIRILANPPDREIPKFWTFFFRHHEFDLFLTHGTKTDLMYNCYLTVWSL